MDEADEAWAAVPGFEGSYEVSSAGRVRSVDRLDALGRHRAGQVLVPQRRGSGVGHPAVTLCADGRRESRYVHQIVLEAFRGPAPPRTECTHLDGDNSNNALSNLAYLNADQRAELRVALGMMKGEAHPSAKLTNEIVRQMRAAAQEGQGRQAIADRFGVSDSTVGLVIRRVRWSHVDDSGEWPPEEGR